MITKLAGVVPKVTLSNPSGSVSPVQGKTESFVLMLLHPLRCPWRVTRRMNAGGILALRAPFMILSATREMSGRCTGAGFCCYRLQSLNFWSQKQANFREMDAQGRRRFLCDRPPPLLFWGCFQTAHDGAVLLEGIQRIRKKSPCPPVIRLVLARV
jgi:hypothetical protein